MIYLRWASWPFRAFAAIFVALVTGMWLSLEMFLVAILFDPFRKEKQALAIEQSMKATNERIFKWFGVMPNGAPR